MNRNQTLLLLVITLTLSLISVAYAQRFRGPFDAGGVAASRLSNTELLESIDRSLKKLVECKCRK